MGNDESGKSLRMIYATKRTMKSVLKARAPTVGHSLLSCMTQKKQAVSST